MKEKPLTADEAVAFGVIVLDAYFEAERDWRADIDLDLLAMHSASRCVLGQVFGYFDTGLRDLDIVSIAGAVRHGFGSFGSECGWPSYAELEAAWRRALTPPPDVTHADPVPAERGNPE